MKKTSSAIAWNDDSARRPVIKDYTSIKPMSMLVVGYDRVALCEMLLWKFWNGVE